MAHTTIESGSRRRFIYRKLDSFAGPDGWPSYRAHDGQIVTVLKRATGVEDAVHMEAGFDETMYDIEASDGWYAQAYESELTPLDGEG